MYLYIASLLIVYLMVGQHLPFQGRPMGSLWWLGWTPVVLFPAAWVYLNKGIESLAERGLAPFEPALVDRLSGLIVAGFITVAVPILWLSGWPVLVLDHWACDGTLWIDELLLVAPLLALLAALLWVDLSRVADQGEEANTSSLCRKATYPRANPLSRAGGVTVEATSRHVFPVFSIEPGNRLLKKWWARVRQEWMVVLLPAMALLGARDAATTNGDDPLVSSLLVAAALILFIAIFPFFIGRLWRLKPMGEGMAAQLASQGLGCEGDKCWPRGLSLNRWDTGNRAVNAIVVGILPWGRRLVLTDGLLALANPDELKAMVRHELGHIHHRHVAWRIAIVLAPLAICLATTAIQVSLNLPSICHLIESSLAWKGIAFGIYVLYVLVFLSWLAKEMEFQADLFAAGLSPDRNGGAKSSTAANGNTDRVMTDPMVSMLRKLASKTPAMVHSGGWLHPSLMERIVELERARANREIVLDRRRAWRFGLACLLGTQLLLACGLWSVPWLP